MGIKLSCVNKHTESEDIPNSMFTNIQKGKSESGKIKHPYISLFSPSNFQIPIQSNLDTMMFLYQLLIIIFMFFPHKCASFLSSAVLYCFLKVCS